MIAICILSVIFAVVIISVPYNQIVEVREDGRYLSDEGNRIEITYGGPRVTWVTVICNITAEINFMYPNGTWIEMQNILLASMVSDRASFNYNQEQVTTIVEIIAEEPFTAHIIYTYLVVMRMSFVERLLFTLNSLFT